MPPERDTSRETRSPGFVGQVLRIAAKDILLEWRSREIIYTMTLFAVLVVVIFAFAFSGGGAATGDLAGGILWVVMIFSGTLGLGRFFDHEREGDTIRALLLSPASPAALYLGKLLGVLLFILVTEAVVVPLVILLFGVQVTHPHMLALLLFMGSLGFSAVGSLFAASLMQSRSRDVLLGVLLFPIATPIVIAGSKGTAALMAGPGAAAGALVWLELMVVFDLVFITLSMWAFGPLTRSE